MQSEDGRILILQVVIDDTKLVCGNIYAPNDPGAQHRFYLHLNDILQKFSSERLMHKVRGSEMMTEPIREI